jgi:1,2-diacylglycerol 3-alpha-glucosyltransferase
MKIAIASSGLGHIARGVETWARDTADALHARGVDVTLFCGAPSPARGKGAPRVAVPCLRRRTLLSRSMVRLLPGLTWRWGLKTGYGLEQLTFWMNLRRPLRQGNFDILHVQDPMVAFWCRRVRTAGRIATQELLAHGTEEAPEFLAQFANVQHLLQHHLDVVMQSLGWRDVPPGWFVAPNFVDLSRFTRVASAERQRAIRRQLGIPEEAFVVGSAGAIKRHHKRMDYLTHEFAVYLKEYEQEQTKGTHRPPPSDHRRAHLAIAGAREDETDALIHDARALLGDRVSFLVNHPFEQMPEFYQALDVFVLPSLFEMMGIVFAEAMACGVPALAHAHPALRDVVGDGGRCIDMTGEGNLAAALDEFRGANDGAWRARARTHVERRFATEVVIRQYLKQYATVAG